MSDPTHVCVAVIMTPEHFDEYESEDETFIDFCEEKFEQYTYCNDAWKEGMPSQITFGYESSAAWGIGQNSDFQDGHDETVGNVFIIGYELASTWNGVILLNEPLLKEIESMKKELKILFPNFTPQVIVRGFQV